MDIRIFSSPQFGTIRTAGSQDTPIFCASDVCRALGYTNGRKAVADHCDAGDVTKCDTPTQSGVQRMTFVNESGLFSLIFGSRLNEARQFKRWVTSEVLPAIRKTGGYINASADESPEEIMAKALVIAQSTIDKLKQDRQILESRNAVLQQENLDLAPKAQYTDQVLQAKDTYTHSEMAKELNFKSWKAFVDACKADGILFKQSGIYMLYSKHAGHGYMKARTTPYRKSDGSMGTNTISVWTEEGRRFLHEHFDIAMQPIDLTMFDLSTTT